MHSFRRWVKKRCLKTTNQQASDKIPDTMQKLKAEYRSVRSSETE
jgi:hypothetical protein